MLDLLRVTEEQETTGLDWIKHKEPAYPIGTDNISKYKKPKSYRKTSTI